MMKGMIRYSEKVSLIQIPIKMAIKTIIILTQNRSLNSLLE